MSGAIGYRKEKTWIEQLVSAAIVFAAVMFSGILIGALADAFRSSTPVFILIIIILNIASWFIFKQCKEHIILMAQQEN